MDRGEALSLIEAPAPDDRLRGARCLVRTCVPDDSSSLRAALSKETNKWVKTALKKALKSVDIDGPTPIEAGADDEEERIVEQITAEAVEETTRRLVHEIRPVLGRLELAARSEISNYEESQTKTQWERLNRLIAFIDTLSRAASSPIYKEFDLPTVITALIAAETPNAGPAVRCSGPQPFLVLSDATFIEIIVANAIRNAVEASVDLHHTEPIVVTWDATDRDYWIAVLDRGCGLPAGSQKIFEIGSTTKKGHFGMGLATAKQAALSLNGRISFLPRDGGGVRFEFRWPKPAK
jgi:signal transduction histidine kinase